jgi:hypothetical protein
MPFSDNETHRQPHPTSLTHHLLPANALVPVSSTAIAKTGADTNRHVNQKHSDPANDISSLEDTSMMNTIAHLMSPPCMHQPTNMQNTDK